MQDLVPVGGHTPGSISTHTLEEEVKLDLALLLAVSLFIFRCESESKELPITIVMITGLCIVRMSEMEIPRFYFNVLQTCVVLIVRHSAHLCK